MSFSIFQCPCCRMDLHFFQEVSHFPLCEVCRTSLVLAPPLCTYCGSPACPAGDKTACLRPWIYKNEIDSYSAKYLLLGQSYAVLKAWKRKSGLLFDRTVLQADSSLIEWWNQTQAEAIIPIPQVWNRSWKLNGSPAEKIAIWIKSQTRLPIVNCFRLERRNSKRQAELSLTLRLKNRIPLQLDPKEISTLRNVILVDDFMTTGKTLYQAASLLKNSGIQKVHVFCLGVRPARMNS